MVSSMASATRSASKYFFGCRNSKVEQSDFDMYVQAFASTVDATHIGNNVTRSIKPGVEFLTSSFVTLKAAMLLDTYKNFTVSPVVRTSALALYVINAWGVPPTLDRVWLETS
jgi:hypothetical protein